ncbi:MAG: glycosyltransferase [Candidatus Gastranaerophilaceae bacterium]
MQKVYVILPDTIPYSLCAKSFVHGFRYSGFYVEYTYSSELDKYELLEFNPDIIMCFDFNEIKDGSFDLVLKKNPNCVFIFDFLTNVDLKKDPLELIYNFKGKKLIYSTDTKDVKHIEKAKYLSNCINFKNYGVKFSGYNSGITIMSNPDNINFLKTITDLISYFGKISIYADEVDYVKSLENELWKEINDGEIKNLYKISYKGEIRSEIERAKVFSSSVINVVPVTKSPNGIDYRILEISAASGFTIAEETSAIKKHFDIGRNIETYKNSTELIDKIEFYLKHPSLSWAIGLNARKTIVNNFSSTDIVKKIVKNTNSLQNKNQKE